VLAGSALDMMSAVRNSVATLGVDVAEAAWMASMYPADFLGLAPQGRIAVGARAAFVVVDRELRVREVVG
jgi:N-acetylglucosamine-6-phosphate deacetylase